MSKSIYALQPTLLGSKTKSFAVTLPVKVVRALGIDESTILALKADEMTRTITIEICKPTLETTHGA